MAIFSKKRFSRNKHIRFSRIPFGEVSLAPYKIRPYTRSLVEGLNEQLNEIVNNAPESLDGQNGDVLDNYIKNWENRAKANLNTQRALRADTILTLYSQRQSHLKNAYDWLEYEEKSLKAKQAELKDVETIYKNQCEKYINW